jgi:hypothetical protein
VKFMEIPDPSIRDNAHSQSPECYKIHFYPPALLESGSGHSRT